MSFDQNQHLLRVVDTRLNNVSENAVSHVVEQGAAVSSYIKLPSVSNSNQNTNFNLNNIAPNVCRDPRLVLTQSVYITITAQNTTGAAINIIQSSNFGFKQYPLNRCISSVQHQINQASETLTSSEILSEIARINCFPEDMNFYDNAMPDYVDSYTNAQGTNFNPLAAYSGTLAGNGVFKPRTVNYSIYTKPGVISANSVPANSTGTLILQADLYEPLITPFTNISTKNAPGLYGINGENIAITWLNDLANNMIAYSPPPGLTVSTVSGQPTGISVSYGEPGTAIGNANLFCVYLTPHASMMSSIPQQSVQHYNQYQTFSTAISGAVAAGASVSTSSSVCQFTNIPFRILVYARLTNTSRTFETPDKYLQLTSLSCQLDNGAFSFNGASSRQLVDASIRNGLQMPPDVALGAALNYAETLNGTFPPALYGCSSVMVIDPAMDLQLAEGLTNGSPGRYIFQVQNATFKNTTGTSFPSVTLYVVGINNAVLERVGTEYRNYLLSIDSDKLKKAKDLPAVSLQEYTDSRFANSFLSGGNPGFSQYIRSGLHRLKSAARRGVEYLQENPQVIHKGLEYAKKALGGARKPAVRSMDLFYE